MLFIIIGIMLVVCGFIGGIIENFFCKAFKKNIDLRELCMFSKWIGCFLVLFCITFSIVCKLDTNEKFYIINACNANNEYIIGGDIKISAIEYKNKMIWTHKQYANSPWLGIFMSKEIAGLDYIQKTDRIEYKALDCGND